MLSIAACYHLRMNDLSFAAWLNEYRERLGIDGPTALARHFDLPQPTVSRWLAGGKPSMGNLLRVAKVSGEPLGRLQALAFSGHAPVELGSMAPRPVPLSAQLQQTVIAARALERRVAELEAHIQQHAHVRVTAIQDRIPSECVDDPAHASVEQDQAGTNVSFLTTDRLRDIIGAVEIRPEDSTAVLVFEVEAAADARTHLFADQGTAMPIDVFWVPKARLRNPASRVGAIKVRGECMLPDLRHGDTVIVEETADWRHNDRVLALVDDALHLKHIQRNHTGWVLVPNDGGPTIRVDDRVHVLGVVLARVEWFRS